jgi:hypothetical protein
MIFVSPGLGKAPGGSVERDSGAFGHSAVRAGAG